jgi:hypothetical protein
MNGSERPALPGHRSSWRRIEKNIGSSINQTWTKKGRQDGDDKRSVQTLQTGSMIKSGTKRRANNGMLDEEGSAALPVRTSRWPWKGRCRHPHAVLGDCEQVLSMERVGLSVQGGK